MIRIRVAFALSAVTIALTGCAVSGTPVAGEIDVRKLEVGTFAVEKRSHDEKAGSAGPLVEGMRMSGAVPPTVRIDPSMSYGRGSTVIPSVERALDFIANVSRPVLENRKFVTGYVTLGADRADPDGSKRPGADATAITTAVLRFPDSASATLAARELEDVDLAVSPDNRKLASTKYPEAYVHWRPGIPTVGAFHAHKEFVISLFVQRPRADADDLVSWIDMSLEASLAQLAKFTPTPYDKLADLPVDPDGLLARAVVEDTTETEPDQSTFAVYSPEHIVSRVDDETARERLLEAAGADRYALVEGGAIARVRDQAGAEALMQGFIDSAEHYDSVPAPTDVPGAKCFELNSKGDSDVDSEYRCYVPYKRYLAIVGAEQESEIRQKVAAQYALLANSL
ncbi:DUF7373 family lipoprotein [Nocardia rosealba]|uniref:DUF7373 family lipoprotein n=1 Tax=Nocardia rosealba TaxID=2878563 RepID=UPI001CD971B6|nr:hypothetical protein [Nocardia rosealba]MCA2210282.1 hypothetical protein [Nocardia rosealba]